LNDANKTIVGETEEGEPDPFKRFQPASTWTPLIDPQSSLQKCKQEVDKIPLSKPTIQSNMTRREKKALQSLRAREDIVIKPADKGGAVVGKMTCI